VIPRWKRSGDTILGLEENGAEIVRVPLREPTFIRQAFDQKYQIARTNCP
jgi:nitrate reductase beta subunit